MFTEDQLQKLVSKFNNQTLSKEEWSHEAHLAVAMMYLLTYSFEDAVCRIKSGIILLNKSHQTENTGNSGYHETLTLFWAKTIFKFIQENRLLTPLSMVNSFLESPYSSREWPLKHYSKELLFSSKSRMQYVISDKF